MFTTIYFIAGGWTIFDRVYRRRRYGRRMPLVPHPEVARVTFHLTAEEVGQVLGGN